MALDAATAREFGITVGSVTVTSRNGTTALRDASFTVPKGIITALVGVNCAGKSTCSRRSWASCP